MYDQTNLFSGIDPGELESLLVCINARCVCYKKDSFIIEEGSKVADFGIMLSGRAQSIKWDASGRLIIITLIEKGGVIGVMIAAMPASFSPVAVQVTEDSEVMLIPYNRITARCNRNCPRHETLLKNYIGVVAEKGLELHERINCLLEPTVRDKVLAYLSRVAQQQSSDSFDIPISRNVMAEYLNIERSSLSRELSNMKKDGLIDYHRNTFKIYEKGE